MVAVMKVVDYKNDNAFTLPINALLSSGNENYVYKVGKKDNKKIAVKTIITTGKTYNGVAEITSGLSAGDEVITTGQFNIVDGSVIK